MVDTRALGGHRDPGGVQVPRFGPDLKTALLSSRYRSWASEMYQNLPYYNALGLQIVCAPSFYSKLGAGAGYRG